MGRSASYCPDVTRVSSTEKRRDYSIKDQLDKFPSHICLSEMRWHDFILVDGVKFGMALGVAELIEYFRADIADHELVKTARFLVLDVLPSDILVEVYLACGQLTSVFSHTVNSEDRHLRRHGFEILGFCFCLKYLVTLRISFLVDIR